MKNKKILFSMCCLLIANIIFLSNTRATEESVTFSPSQVIVNEKDLGKNYTITVNNTSATPYTFTVEEQLVTKEGEKMTILPATIENKRLEIAKNEFSLKANEKIDLTVRVKIFSNESFESFPALIFKEKASNSTNIKVLLQSIIPFIVQNTKGEYKLDSSMSLNVQNYTTDNKITIEGIVTNIGTKFFNTSGVVVISKNGVTLAEKELTSQISGLFFPKETRDFKIGWTNDKDYFDALGEYTVESRITNNETNKTLINRTTFIYIPKNLIVLLISALGGIVGLIIIISIIKKIIRNSKLKKESYQSQ
jgi:hypothetical protein